MAKAKARLYEGMYVLSATLSEEAREKALEKITTSVRHHAGEVHKIFPQGRQKLSYEINQRKEGYYYVIYFTASSLSMSELWREYQLNEDLIRFMTLRADAVPEKLEFKELIPNE